MTSLPNLANLSQKMTRESDYSIVGGAFSIFHNVLQMEIKDALNMYHFKTTTPKKEVFIFLRKQLSILEKFETSGLPEDILGLIDEIRYVITVNDNNSSSPLKTELESKIS